MPEDLTSVAPAALSAPPVQPSLLVDGGFGVPANGDYRLLDAFHVGTAVLVGVVVARTGDGRPADVGAALAAIAAGTAAYLLAGRRLHREEATAGRRAWLYVAVQYVLFAVACWFAPEAAWLLFSLCLQAFTMLGVWPAVGAVAVFTVTPAAADLLAPRHAVGDAVTGVGRALAVTVASGLGAAWIDSMATRSRERAELVRQLHASQARVAELSHQAGTDAERARLSGEIHDTLAQGFLSILNLLRVASATLAADPASAGRFIALAQDTARDNLAEARSMVAALAPPALATDGLVGALHRRAERLRQETGMACSVEVGELPPLTRDAEVVLLRAAQELLTNTEKHAHARNVSIRLAATADGEAVLTVADDGLGLDASAATSSSSAGSGGGGGFGLRTMRERAAALGGAVHVGPGPDGGTVAEVRVAASPGRPS